MGTVATLLYSVSVVNLALAGVVFLRRPQAEVNRVFALTSFSVAAWTLTNALFQATDSVRIATLAANLSYISALVVAASLLHFSRIFPKHPNRPHRKASPLFSLSLWSVTALLSATLCIPGFVIGAVELEPARRIVTHFGLYPISVFLFVTVLGAMRFLLRSLATNQGKERMQARYVLTGMAVTASLGLFCNLVLPLAGNYALVWLGPASSLVFVGCSVYSIVREHLFDIRIVIKKTLVYSLLLAAIAGGYSAVEYVMKEALQQTAPGGQHPFVTSIGGTIIVSLFASPAQRWLEKRIDKVIFGHKLRKEVKRV